jgi:hypothetical protein
LNEETLDGRIIMLTTRENLSILANSEVWLCDGTFFVCPRDFYQLFTIFGLIKNKSFPLLYCLLPSKKERIYEKMFFTIKNLIGDMNLKFLLCDFELAIPNSFFSVFKDVEIFFLLFSLLSIIVSEVYANGV